MPRPLAPPSFLLALCLCAPLSVMAQAEPEVAPVAGPAPSSTTAEPAPAPTPEPVFLPDLVPARPKPELGAPVVGAPPDRSGLPVEPAAPTWSVGAGITLASWSSGSSGTRLSLSPLGYSSQSAPAIGTEVQPRLGVSLERRVATATWFTFQAAGAYGASQDDRDPDLWARQVTLDATLGVRHVFNPGGVVEVSAFGAAGVGYWDVLTRTKTTSYYYPDTTPVVGLNQTRAHAFSVGLVGGLVLERELTSGLAVRLSSSILGASYGETSQEVEAPFQTTRSNGHETDVGLRFSPALELRYAF